MYKYIAFLFQLDFVNNAENIQLIIPYLFSRLKLERNFSFQETKMHCYQIYWRNLGFPWISRQPMKIMNLGKCKYLAYSVLEKCKKRHENTLD